jgi:hypothetical protein
MKCTRHLCQDASWNTVPIAFFNPECASDMTSFTPSRPRTFNDLRNAVQKLSFFRVSHVEAEHFAASVGGNPNSDDDRLGQDPVVDPRFDIRGVEGHVRVVEGRQGAVAELGDFGVQAGTDPRDFGFRDPGIGSQGLHQIVDLPGRDAVQILFHHHGEQRVVDPAATFQQGGEECSRPQFRDRQVQIPGGRGQHPGAGAVAVGAALGRPLERAGADERGRFGIDQLLVERLGRDPNPVGDVGEFQFAKKVEQGRLVKSHRVLSLS